MVRDAQDVLDLLLGVGARAASRGAGPELDRELGAVARRRSSAGAATLRRGRRGARATAPGEAASALARLELLGYVAATRAGRYARTALRAPGRRAPGIR